MSDSPTTPNAPGSGEVQLPVFAAGEKVCGNCKLWSAHSIDDRRGWVGPCRIQPQRGLFPPSAPICDKFVAKGSVAPAQLPESSTRVKNVAIRNIAPTVIRKSADGVTTLPAPVIRTPRQLSRLNEEVDLEGLSMTRQELMEIFREATGEMREPPELANKWEGGTIQLIPGKADAQAKELPIDALLHKIVMVRDRLRALEQKINGHPKLSDGEKVEMQQYITRVYGSLTSFNVLFKNKEDQFVGQKSDD